MIWIIILGLIAGYREVQILCDRRSWNYLSFRQWFWFTAWNSKWKLWDSFHASNGLFTLVLVCALYAQPEFLFFICNQFWTIIVHIILSWFILMYFRNLMMHVVLPYRPDWWYLIPLIGTWFKHKVSK